MQIYDIRVLFILFMFYSFAGWVMESTRNIIITKRVVNRGFFLGPWIPIYGVGAILMTIFLKIYINETTTLFFMCIFLFASLEYVTSYFMEKIFNARWWDYSNKRFNLNGRVCLETTIPFGLVGLFAMYIVDPFMINLLESLSIDSITILSIILFVLFLTDIIISFKVMSTIKITVNDVKKDNTEQINELVKEILLGKNYSKRRYVHAFPKFNVK